MTLAEYMKEHGLTDQALADRLGLSQPYICRLRKQERRPSAATAKKLEAETQIPATMFLYGEGSTS